MSAPVSRSRRVMAVSALVVLGGLSATACRNDPSPKRVALDMVETMEELSERERECMTDKIDNDYENDDLVGIGEANEDFDFGNRSANEGEQADELNAFIEDLQQCHE